MAHSAAAASVTTSIHTAPYKEPPRNARAKTRLTARDRTNVRTGGYKHLNANYNYETRPWAGILPARRRSVRGVPPEEVDQHMQQSAASMDNSIVGTPSEKLLNKSRPPQFFQSYKSFGVKHGHPSKYKSMEAALAQMKMLSSQDKINQHKNEELEREPLRLNYNGEELQAGQKVSAALASRVFKAKKKAHANITDILNEVEKTTDDDINTDAKEEKKNKAKQDEEARHDEEARAIRAALGESLTRAKLAELRERFENDPKTSVRGAEPQKYAADDKPILRDLTPAAFLHIIHEVFPSTKETDLSQATEDMYSLFQRHSSTKHFDWKVFLQACEDLIMCAKVTVRVLQSHGREPEIIRVRADSFSLYFMGVNDITQSYVFVGRWRMHHECAFRIFWDYGTCFLLFVVTILLPLDVAFSLQGKSIEFSNMIIDLWFFFDLVFNFITTVEVSTPEPESKEAKQKRKAYEAMKPGNECADDDASKQKRRAVTRRLAFTFAEIRQNYVHSWFAVDLISSIPVDDMVVAVNKATDTKSSVNFMKAIKLTKLFKLLRLLRVGRLLRKIQQLYNIKYGTVMIWSFGVMLCIVAHWVGCLYYVYCINKNDPDSWIFSDGEGTQAGVFVERTSFQKYVTLFYWSITTMTTIGYGDINPGTTGERFFVIIAMSVGAGQFAYGLSNVVTAILNSNMAEVKFENLMDGLTDWNRLHDLSNDSSGNLQHQYLFYVHAESTADLFADDRVNALAVLSSGLRRQIMIETANVLFPESPATAHRLPSLYDQLFKCELVQAMIPVIFSPEDTLMSDDPDKGHFQSLNYFYLARGRVSVQLRGKMCSDPRYTELMDEGCTLGEFSIFLGEDFPDTGFEQLHAVARSFCDVYFITPWAILKVFSVFGQDHWTSYSYALRSIGHNHRNKWIVNDSEARTVQRLIEGWRVDPSRLKDQMIQESMRNESGGITASAKGNRYHRPNERDHLISGGNQLHLKAGLQRGGNKYVVQFDHHPVLENMDHAGTPHPQTMFYRMRQKELLKIIEQDQKKAINLQFQLEKATRELRQQFFLMNVPDLEGGIAETGFDFFHKNRETKRGPQGPGADEMATGSASATSDSDGSHGDGHDRKRELTRSSTKNIMKQMGVTDDQEDKEARIRREEVAENVGANIVAASFEETGKEDVMWEERKCPVTGRPMWWNPTTHLKTYENPYDDSDDAAAGTDGANNDLITAGLEVPLADSIELSYATLEGRDGRDVVSQRNVARVQDASKDTKRGEESRSHKPTQSLTSPKSDLDVQAAKVQIERAGGEGTVSARDAPENEGAEGTTSAGDAHKSESTEGIASVGDAHKSEGAEGTASAGDAHKSVSTEGTASAGDAPKSEGAEGTASAGDAHMSVSTEGTASAGDAPESEGADGTASAGDAPKSKGRKSTASAGDAFKSKRAEAAAGAAVKVQTGVQQAHTGPDRAHAEMEMPHDVHGVGEMRHKKSRDEMLAQAQAIAASRRKSGMDIRHQHKRALLKSHRSESIEAAAHDKTHTKAVARKVEVYAASAADDASEANMVALNEAATKVGALFRGKQAREKVNAMREENASRKSGK